MCSRVKARTIEGNENISNELGLLIVKKGSNNCILKIYVDRVEKILIDELGCENIGASRMK